MWLVSYLLIAYGSCRVSMLRAGEKALIVNRYGDSFVLLCMIDCIWMVIVQSWCDQLVLLGIELDICLCC